MSKPFFTVFMFLMPLWIWQATVFAINPTFFALNQSPGPPPNVTGLAGLEDTTTTVLLFWTSGGGNTVNYRISYQAGSTAPANCTTGTQTSEATVGSSTNYRLSGLLAGTEYSFRVCASNGSSIYASGMSLTMRTPVSQPLFRSMGFNSTAAKATGASNAMTISNDIAIFNTGLAGDIGVGDAIQYSSLNNATMDRIAFIHGRISATQFLIKTVAGASPGAVSGNTSWSLFRAYTSFNNAVAGTENSGINAAVQNFDTWTGGANLVTLGATWYIEAYADAAHASTFTNINSGWTTSASNKLIITTPWETRHVGTRQRHAGFWSASYFHATASDNSILEVDISNVVIEGIQFRAVATGAADWFGPVMIGVNTFVPVSSVIEIKNNIIEIVNTSSGYRDIAGIYTVGPNTDLKLYVMNNIVICQGGTGAVGSKECDQGIRGAWSVNDSASWSAYCYNNTVVGDWYYGIDFYNSGTGVKTLYAKNNIVQGPIYEAYAGTVGPGSGNNISHNGTATGSTGDKINTTVSFVDPTVKNYHLAPGDTAAKDSGMNLSTDLEYPIKVDIDMSPRTGTWDIGADEI